MVGAYVLIQTEAGRAGPVVEGVRGVPGVVSVETVTGPYDAIARIEAEDVDGLGRLVVGGVQVVEGITRTLTCQIARF